MAKDRELLGQTAIVTGAAHGFGRQISIALGRLGASIGCCDILDEGLSETTRILEDEGIRVLAKHVDVTSEDAVNAFIQDVVAHFGRVDILVNNAGGTLGTPWQPIDEVSTENWDRIIKSNLYGAFFFTRGVASFMKQKMRGKIVNISSGAGRSHSRTGIHAYTAAKAGLIGFTRQCAYELGPYNINVNAVAPGLVISTKEAREQWEQRSEHDRESVLKTLALRRLGTPLDISNAVVYLVTHAGSWVQGQTLGVDGGHWMF